MSKSIISDDDLKRVSGGTGYTFLNYPVYNTALEVKFKYEVGQTVEVVVDYGIFNHIYTKQCLIVGRLVNADPADHSKFVAWYLVNATSGDFTNRYYPEVYIEDELTEKRICRI